jgi:hypothetical protein
MYIPKKQKNNPRAVAHHAHQYTILYQGPARSRGHFFPLSEDFAPQNFLISTPKHPLPRLKSTGPEFAIYTSAFNRILDFSNGLDFYLGFFFYGYIWIPKLTCHWPAGYPSSY